MPNQNQHLRRRSPNVGIVRCIFCLAVSIASFGNLNFLSHVDVDFDEPTNVHNPSLGRDTHAALAERDRLTVNHDQFNITTVAATIPEYLSLSSASTINRNDDSQHLDRVDAKLIIHAGPLKTATTFLQGVMNKKATIEILAQDNIAVVGRQYDFRFTKNLFHQCLLSPSRTSLQLSSSSSSSALSSLNSIQPQTISEFCRNRIDGFFVGLSKIVHKFMQNQYDKNRTRTDCAPTLILSVEEYSKVPNTFIAKQYFLDRFMTPLIIEIENGDRNKTKQLEWKWDVHILLAYRKVFNWYPSMYHQYRKGLMYKSGVGQYRGFLPDEIEVHGGERTVIVGSSSRSDGPTDLTTQLTFPDWLQNMIDLVERDEEHNVGVGTQEALFPRDSHGLIRFYENYFGSDSRVHVFDFEAQNIEKEFFCHPLLNASQTCSVVTKYLNESINDGRINRTKKANTLSMNLDEDLLVMEAYRQGLFVPQDKNREWSVGSGSNTAPHKNDQQRRQMAGGVKRYKLSLFLRDLFNADPSRLVGPAENVNLTLIQTSQICLKQRQWEWMWNRSVYTDRQIYGNGRIAAGNMTNRESDLKSEMIDLMASKRKGCSLDARRLLSDSSWRTLLQSAAYCLSNTTNCLL